MTTFRIKPHLVAIGCAAVEIIDADGKLMAILYAKDDDSRLRIISRHIGDVHVELAPIAVVEITLQKPE